MQYKFNSSFNYKMNWENSRDKENDIGLNSYHWTNLAAENKSKSSDSCSDSDLISGSGSDSEPKELKKYFISKQKENNAKTRGPPKVRNRIPSSPLYKIEVESEKNVIRSSDLSNMNEGSKNVPKLESTEPVDNSREAVGGLSGFPSRTEERGKTNEINEDWGKRVELHNVLHVNEGDNVWNFVPRGTFGDIKLWKNNYGHICCKASGKMSRKGAPEKSIIEINTEENLRKLLNLSRMQWSALCDAVDERNCNLIFNAFADVDLDKMSPLEKLWFFTCKRRHFLPNICVLGKLSGAVKVMKELRIMPKIVVINIRDFNGEEIN